MDEPNRRAALISFIDEEITVSFAAPPVYEKSPPCPDAFIWRDQTFKITSLLEENHNFNRRGKMEKNMQPAHASRASLRGSFGVGRFSFRVRVEDGRVFDIYYDRAPASVSDRKGRWILRGECRSETDQAL